jgi:hypothetical protein
LKILSAAALLVVVAAGCGSAARPQMSASHELSRALAQDWEGQASAVAAAATAGNSCRALHLANYLRDDVRKSAHQLPLRLRSPLLVGVKALADRITCTPVVAKPVPPRKPHAPPKRPKPKPPKPHGPHGHDKGHDK